MYQKRVTLVGLAGPNMGDTLIAQSVSDALSAIGYEATVVHPSRGRPDLVCSKLIEFKRTSLRANLALVKEFRSTHAVLIGGGSLFQDKLGFSLLRGVLSYVLHAAVLSMLAGKSPSVVAVGIDRLRSRAGKITSALLLRYCTKFIFVRDLKSQRRARILAPDRDIELLPDPAFAIRLPLISTTARWGFVPSRHDCTVAQVAEIYKQIYDQEGLVGRIILSDNSNAECDFANSLCKMLSRSNIEARVVIPTTSASLLSALAECERIYSMRLHPAIFSLADREVCVVPVNEKLRALVDGLGVCSFAGKNADYSKEKKSSELAKFTDFKNRQAENTRQALERIILQ